MAVREIGLGCGLGCTHSADVAAVCGVWCYLLLSFWTTVHICDMARTQWMLYYLRHISERRQLCERH